VREPGPAPGGQESLWADLTASPIFFYVTVDVVSACNLSFPSDAIYWTTYATTRNVLIGDVIYLDARANTSEMVPAVHIEAASGAGGGPSVTGFYEERGVGETNREPLATAFMIDYGSDPAAGISSNLIFWKNFTELDAVDDPKKGSSARWWTAARTCTTPSTWTGDPSRPS